MHDPKHGTEHAPEHDPKHHDPRQGSRQAPKHGKYNPLRKHLKMQARAQIPMTFAEIEGILGTRLPPSARKHRPWWSNNPNNSRITTAWLDAGYVSEQVDMAGERLVFRREPQPTLAVNEVPMHNPTSFATPPAGNPPMPSFYGCMQGLITIDEDYDLTAPAEPTWQQTAAES